MPSLVLPITLIKTWKTLNVLEYLTKIARHYQTYERSPFEIIL